MNDVRASNQLGRSALLIHGLMWLTIGACIALGYFIKPSRDMQTVGGMGLSCVLVLKIWSLLLAIRAVAARENWFWPVAVLAVGLFEISVLSGFLFFGTYEAIYADWNRRYGLAVLAPVLAVACMISIPVAMWRCRDAETRSGLASTRARRWMRGAAWFLPVTLLFIMVALPVPLFVHALRMQSRYGRLAEGTLPKFALENTPVWIADAVAELYSKSTTSNDAAVYWASLDSGRVSRQRLLNEIQSGAANNRASALVGLQKSHPREALELAEKIGMQGNAPPMASSLDFVAGNLLAQYGTAEQVRRMLATAENATATTAFLAGMIQTMGWAKRPEFLPDLEKLLATSPAYHEQLLWALAFGSSENDVERIWLTSLDDPVNARVDEVMNGLSNIQSEVLRRRILMVAMTYSRPYVRLGAMKYYATNLIEFMDFTSTRENAALLIKLVDDNDLEVRRAATRNAWSMISAPNPISAPAGTPETQLEIDSRETLRSKLRIWQYTAH